MTLPWPFKCRSPWTLPVAWPTSTRNLPHASTGENVKIWIDARDGASSLGLPHFHVPQFEPTPDGPSSLGLPPLLDSF